MHRAERHSHVVKDHKNQENMEQQTEVQKTPEECLWHCDVCQATLGTVSQLQVHMSDQHPSVVCEHFEASLANASAIYNLPQEQQEQFVSENNNSDVSGEPSGCHESRIKDEMQSVENIQPPTIRDVDSSANEDVVWHCNLCKRKFHNSTILRIHMREEHVQSVCSRFSASFGIVSVEHGYLSQMSAEGALDLLEVWVEQCYTEKQTEFPKTKVTDVVVQRTSSDIKQVPERNAKLADNDTEQTVKKEDGTPQRPENVIFGADNAEQNHVNSGILSDSSAKRKYNTGNCTYKCYYCKQNYGRISTLRDHLYLHSGEKRFKCPNCATPFMSRSRLHKHIKLDHNGISRKGEDTSVAKQNPAQEIVWQCTCCDVSFGQLHALAFHLNEKHKNIDGCTFEAKFKKQLTRDMLKNKPGTVFSKQQGLNDKKINRTDDGKILDEVCVNDDNTYSGRVGLESQGSEGHLRNETPDAGGSSSLDGKITEDQSEVVEDTHVTQQGATGYVKETGTSKITEEHPPKKTKDVDDESKCNTNAGKKLSYRCSYCQKTLKNAGSVRDHLYLHTDEKRYQCPHCTMQLMTRSSLRSHLKLNHNDVASESKTRKVKKRPAQEIVWNCLYCNTSCETIPSVQYHMKLQHQVTDCHTLEARFCKELASKVKLVPPLKPLEDDLDEIIEIPFEMPFKVPDKCEYTCKYCAKTYSRPASLKDHLVSSVHAGKNVYRCFYCSEAFTFRSSRSKHCKLMHPSRVEHTNRYGKERWQKVSKTIVWNCSVCKQQFHRVDALHFHMEHKHKIRDCKKLEASFFESEDKNTSLFPYYTCECCGKSFNSQYNLLKHERSVQTSKPVTYNISKGSFNSSRELRDHDEEGGKTRDGVRHLCKFCGKVFDRKCTLTYHEKIHGEGKKHRCNQCPKRFISQRVLIKHQGRCHLNPAQPKVDHLCQICGKSFGLKKVLEGHVNIHLGVRPFQCEKCRHTFPSQHRLRRHIAGTKCRSNHICQICGKSFGLKKALEGHVNIHLGVRPFQCDKCLHTFPSQDRLRRHIASTKCRSKIDLLPTQFQVNTGSLVGQNTIKSEWNDEDNYSDDNFLSIK